MTRNRNRAHELPSLTQDTPRVISETPTPPEPVKEVPFFTHFTQAGPGETVATLPRELKRKRPDEFEKAEANIRGRFVKAFPGESLLRQETRDRTLIRYYRGG